MTDPAKRERAALDVLALLPEPLASWPTSYDPERKIGLGHEYLQYPKLPTRGTLPRSRGATTRGPRTGRRGSRRANGETDPGRAGTLPVKVQEGGPWLVVFAAPSPR